MTAAEWRKVLSPNTPGALLRDFEAAEAERDDYESDLTNSRRLCDGETERADLAEVRAQAEQDRFSSLVQELDETLRVRGHWIGDKTARDGARLIQAVGMALQAEQQRREAAEARVRELLAQWRKEITGAPKNNDYLRGYWDGRATAHRDLTALAPQERGGEGSMKLVNAMGFCLCGRKIETTGGGLPVTAEYRNGECVYAVCSHGVAVIDNRAPQEPQTGGKEEVK
jgi:hypothetical protein